jgi:hypothetical protein
MTVYISGAVTGRPNKNKQAFQGTYTMIGEFKSRPHLRDMKIINPLHIAARLEKSFAARGKEPVWEDYMRAQQLNGISQNGLTYRARTPGTSLNKF